MASQSISTITKATSVLPWIGRFLITTIEPLMAVGGVVLCLTKPEDYLSGLTRESVTSIDSATKFVYTQLGGGWLVIIFAEAVIMRLVDDIRVWKLLCTAILLSDMLYTHSLAEAVGGWGRWAVLKDWTTLDWVATVTTWPFVLIRVAIVTGLLESRKMKRR